MKSKFSKKLLALFLAVVMAVTSLTGAFSAFAADAKDYHDDNIISNALGWVELQSDQTLEALLDYVDDVLGGANLNLFFSYSIVGQVIKVDGKLDSVSGILDTVYQLKSILNLKGIIGGDVKNVTLSPLDTLSYNENSNESITGKAFRERNSAREIINALLNTIYNNTQEGNSVIKQVLIGQLDLGLIKGALDVYKMIGDALGFPDTSYKSNLVFNIIAQLITTKTDWYTEEEKANIMSQAAGYELDTMLFKALQDSLLKNINIQVTYPDGTNSRSRYEAGDLEEGLFYTPDGNVYIFRYDSNGDDIDDADLTITPQTNLFDFSYQALEIAWKTVLAPTIGLINSAVKDYDWNYVQWFLKNAGQAWDYDNVENNYTEALVTAWAEADGVDLEKVQADLSYNREIVDDPVYNWRDIDSTRLFNELRRSPLMAYYFKAETGPLNTNFQCTGTPNIDKFMSESYGNYSSILAGLNDFLVAAVKDFIPGYAADGGTFITTGDTINASAIANALVTNACAIFQYAADKTDKNILSAFYHNGGTALNESNFEEAMIPFLISCLENNITDLKQIHKDKWDNCKDAEGVAVVVLEEYLSYILPNRDYSPLITKDADGFYDVTVESAILPMARDAVGYVMMQYVPVKDGNGNNWFIYDEGSTVTTYEQQVAAKTDIFSLLNSVICYYGNEKGIANLLGLCTPNGTCKITLTNTIWQNIDLIANHLLPVFGELQYGNSNMYGKLNSYDLIWNDLVSGFLNIADVHSASNGGGVTNFIYRLATIISAPSIQSKGIVNVAYDFAKDVLNAIFDARYTDAGQTYTNIIPANSGAHPFHDAAQVNVIAGTPGVDTEIGIIGKAIVNVVEFAGNRSSNYPDTVYDGLTFIVQSLASLIKGFCPQLKEYVVGKADATVVDFVKSGYSAGSNIKTSLAIENTGNGLNRYTLNPDGSTTQVSRSYIVVKSVSADKGSFNVTTNATPIAPQSTSTFPVSGSLSASQLGDENEALVTFTVTYKIVDSKGTTISPNYENLKTEAYMYVSSAPDWKSLTYNDSTASGFVTDLSPASKAQTGDYVSMSGELMNSFSLFGGGYKYCGMQFPTNVVVKTSQLSDLSAIHVWLKNNSTQGEKAVDGIIVIKDNASKMALTCNAVTGDVTNIFFYDYYQLDYETKMVDDGNGNTVEVKEVITDENGNTTGHWVTDDPKNRDDVLSLVDTDNTVSDYRHHVVCAHSDIAAKYGGCEDDKNEDGSFNCIWVPISGNTYKEYTEWSLTDPNDASASTGIQGIALKFNKISKVAAESQNKYDFLAWDQETQIKPVSRDVSFRIVCGSSKDFDINFSICDDSEAADILNRYDEALDLVNDFAASDFKDPQAHAYLKEATKNALKTNATAVTKANAGTVGSTKANFAVTNETANFYGDVAYLPMTEAAISAEEFALIKMNSYKNPADGIYYQTKYTNADDEVIFDNPVYGNIQVTDNDVTLTGDTISFELDGKTVTCPIATVNVSGEKVVWVKVPGEDATAVWHILNDAAPAREWVDLGNGTAPWFADPYNQATGSQKIEGEGKNAYLVYDEVSFVYRDANGIKCTSKDNWAVKIAEVNYTVCPFAAARGVYAKGSDMLNYALELAYKNIHVADAAKYYTQISVLRDGLNNVNFNVVTYEKMASLGREAEKLFSVDRYHTNTFTPVEDGVEQEPIVISCLDSEFDDIIAEYNEANGTTYEWRNFEHEEDVDQAVVTSQTSTFKLDEALRLFNTYLATVYERGYIGDKLNEEISCAVNGKSCEDKDVKTTPYTAVTVDTEAASYTVSGTTYTASSNPDGVTYTDESWSDFIVALDDAVTAATEAPNYAHAASAKFVPSDKENYTYKVSNVYNTRKALMIAENNLTEFVEEAGDGYAVTGYVGALAKPGDALGTYAVTGAVVSITTADGTEISAATDNDGKFTLEAVPAGTYTATLTYKYGFDRTFTITVVDSDVASTDKIGIVACNWSKDDIINVMDYGVYSAHYLENTDSPNYDLGVDITHDGNINVLDYGVYSAFYFATLADTAYAPYTLAN